eukprot:CAMPEP_0198134488 /NCGR_PEP_ID=MMETSP1442-20131203/60102_1 /TAXON_ID= /ORGANISM="Craspedostauros australis, Strain CCMP3328" /LENGTH=62 /DNA_ID=CAMNT_0043795633 /DNA_START=876 /DNA_END=1064 /DNA_ORIENTATION=-
MRCAGGRNEMVMGIILDGKVMGKCCSRIFSIRRKTDDGISVRMDTKLEIHLEAFWDVSTCPQ